MVPPHRRFAKWTWPLRALVHAEAFRARPSAYLQGVVWRARGLKLRARHRFSALMGQTRHAYELWIAGREPVLHAAIAHQHRGTAALVLVIDCRGADFALVDQTLTSIEGAEGQPAQIILLGCDPAMARGHGSVADSDALAQQLEEHGTAADERLWILAVSAGDRLAAPALAAYRAALAAAPGAVLFYADDDLIEPSGRRHSPHFKPRWNAELFAGHDYLSGSCAFAADPAAVRGAGPDWPRRALPLAGPEPVHIPLVLHHRGSRPAPRALHAMQPATLIADSPHVSIVVPTRNHVALLRTCMAGLAVTRYPAMDITVIDNGSNEPDTLTYLAELEASGIRISRQPGPFNYAAMHNQLVPDLRGPLLCLLNNDIEVIDPDWLAHMVPHALRDDIGAVGARLLYPDRTIQHAGIVIGVGGGAGHAHRLQPDSAPGYFGRAHLPQRVSAVTAACLVMRKDRFQAVGGFDAANFTVAFNDVDLCLKLNSAGWHSFYEARACLVHHESKSRGHDRRGPGRARLADELAALKRLWATDRIHDPFHHPELSQFTEQFVVRL